MTQPTAVTELIERLQGVREGLPEAIKALEEEQERIATQLRTLKGLQRTLSPNGTSTPPKSAKSAPEGQGRAPISDARVLAIAEGLLARPNKDDKFTAIDMATELGLSEPFVYQAIKRLRELEFVAMAGQAPPMRKGVRGRALYVLDPHASDVLEQLRSNP